MDLISVITAFHRVDRKQVQRFFQFFDGLLEFGMAVKSLAEGL